RNPSSAKAAAEAATPPRYVPISRAARADRYRPGLSATPVVHPAVTDDHPATSDNRGTYHPVIIHPRTPHFWAALSARVPLPLCPMSAGGKYPAHSIWH